MLLGYMRVSKADGSQVLDLQRDALLAAGVEPGQLYEDLASGKRDDRPGLAADAEFDRPATEREPEGRRRGFHQCDHQEGRPRPMRDR